MDDDRSSARAQRASENVNQDIAAAVPAAGWREAAPNENQNENHQRKRKPKTKTSNENRSGSRSRCSFSSSCFTAHAARRALLGSENRQHRASPAGSPLQKRERIEEGHRGQAVPGGASARSGPAPRLDQVLEGERPARGVVDEADVRPSEAGLLR